MNKKIRQYIGLFVSVVSYYMIHEGAHFLYALFTNTFKKVNFMVLGIQVDVYADCMNTMQMFIFCLVGSIATLVCAYLLIFFINKIEKCKSKVLKASLYYITIVLLFLDPLYLSILCGYFGGGDMNGIALLIDEMVVRSMYAGIFVVNLLLFLKIILPSYTKMFEME